jgi:phosphoglucosamine mutase
LAQAVRAHHADYGIALDGDADRLQMVDAQGRSSTAMSCCS